MGIHAITNLVYAKDYLAKARIINKQEIEETTANDDFESQYVMHLEDIQESLENAYVLTVEAYKKAVTYDWYVRPQPRWWRMLKVILRGKA